MSKVEVLTKKGKILKIQTLQSVDEIWEQIMGTNPNKETHQHFLILNTSKGKPYIINKRYIYKIEE